MTNSGELEVSSSPVQSFCKQRTIALPMFNIYRVICIYSSTSVMKIFRWKVLVHNVNLVEIEG